MHVNPIFSIIFATSMYLSMFSLLIILLIHNTDLEMSRIAGQLLSIKKLALLLDDSIDYKKRDEYNNRCQSLFLDSCNHYVEALEFKFPCRCKRSGRQSSMLSWFENQMKDDDYHRSLAESYGEEDIEYFMASEEQPLNSLRDLNNGAEDVRDNVYIKDGKFLGPRQPQPVMREWLYLLLMTLSSY
jgi:hypothetical protein